MISKRMVFEICRLHNLGWSERRIARDMRLGRPTVKKYLENPEQGLAKQNKPRVSKLDPYRDLIDQFLLQDPTAKAPVILQRLQQNGFDGKITILRDYLQKIRGQIKYKEPFIRFESDPGQQMQIDWGHFGSLTYLPLGSQGSNLFFQVISQRHEQCSTIITTNLAFAEWGKIFDSTTVATAIADRLVYNSEVLILEGPSYRKKAK